MLHSSRSARIKQDIYTKQHTLTRRGQIYLSHIRAVGCCIRTLEVYGAHGWRRGAGFDHLDNCETNKSSFGDFYPHRDGSVSPPNHDVHLDSFTLHDFFTDRLIDWMNTIKFSSLQELDVWVTENVTRDLITFARTTGFSHLTALSLKWHHYYWTNTSTSRDNLFADLMDLLAPLTHLNLIQDVGPRVCESIVGKHGAHLRSLTLLELSTHFLNDGPPRGLRYQNHIERVLDASPNLESISFQVRRTLGDEHEVAIYRCLGRLQNLR